MRRIQAEMMITLRVVEANDRHIRCYLFMTVACNGHLSFTHGEYEKFVDLLQDGSHEPVNIEDAVYRTYLKRKKDAAK